MVPVYRLRDGIRMITKNKEIFSYCSEFLLENKSIIIFPEGNHSLNRSVRSLSKGFTRIIVEYFNKRKDQELVIIPVGLNFQSPRDFGNQVSIYYGKSIDPAIFLNSNNILNIKELKNKVQDSLKELTTHIEIDNDYENTIRKLNALNVDYTNPNKVNECINNQFKYEGNKVKSISGLFYIFKFLTILFYSVPYFIWKRMVFPKIIQDEFIGTFRFLIIITLAPLFLIIEAVLITVLFGNVYGLLTILAGIFIPLITSKIK